MRALVLRAVRARGALTESGIAEHYRVPGRTATVRPHVEALVAEGALRRLEVDDGGPGVLVSGQDPLLESVPAGATLLSPFDNLLWDRGFARRLFGFDHVMEIYKPAPQRVYGYYVLPVLRGDRIVGSRGPQVGPPRGPAPGARLPPRARRARLRRAGCRAHAGTGAPGARGRTRGRGAPAVRPARVRAGRTCPDPARSARPRSSASISAISLSLRWKPKTSKFSSIRSGVTDLGNTTFPSWRCQRSTTWPGVRSCASAMATITGSSSTSPWASGLQASVTIPRSSCSRRSPACWKRG